jgi:hypothetical protein
LWAIMVLRARLVRGESGDDPALRSLRLGYD